MLHGAADYRPVYVVGSGPSMRLFPIEVLRGQVTIALNQAWRYFPRTGPLAFGPTYTLTVHPELDLDYRNEGAPVATTWVVKKKPPLAHLTLDDPDRYVFHTSPEWSTIRDQPPDTLFIGRGVQQTALDLAVRMDASAVILVGVDMTDLGGEHHGHDQHVRFHGLEPAAVYAEYRDWTAKARRVIRDEFAIPVLTLNPFLGAGHAEEDYARLKAERGLGDLPAPADTSPYMRKP